VIEIDDERVGRLPITRSGGHIEPLPLTASAIIDSGRRLRPARALPLRCRLASAEMHSDHLLCMNPDGALVSFDGHLDHDDLVVRLPQFHPLVIPSARH